MKRIIYLGITALCLSFSGCDSFLDRQPKSSLSVETYWKTEQDLKTWNAGMYEGLQATLRTSWLYWGEVRSGVYTPRGTGADFNLLYNGLTSQTGSSAWSNIYATVYRANAFIKHIPESPVSTNISAPYLGQAHAMRALMYFYAIRVWGDVPKITEPLEDITTQERYYDRTSVNDLKGFILDDLDAALNYFGAETNTADANKYYLNRGSAMAIKADVLMWYKEYDKALIVMDDLLKNYGYKLEPASSYSAMFKQPERSKEMIFNLFWDYEQDNGGFGYAQELASGSNNIKYHPTERIYKELVARKKEDTRINLVMDTFFISGFIAPEELLDDTYERASRGVYGNSANFQIKCPKFVAFSTTGNKGNPGYVYETNGECSTRMPIYRLADISLLKAEALVRGSQKNYQGALDIVNQIRERSGWNEKALLGVYSTEKEMLKLIVDERTIEFWAEGKRWFDLVRTDLVKEYLDPFLQDPALGVNTIPEGFVVGVGKPSGGHIGGYGKILWPLNQDVFRKNPSMRGKQNVPYEE